WILSDLLPGDPLTAGSVRLQRARISAPNGAVWESRLPAPAISLSRGALDRKLAQAAGRAGTHIREGTRVVSVSGDLESGFRLRLQTQRGTEIISARAVIGAYGRRSRLDRELRRAFMRKSQPFMAFKAHFTGPSLEDRIELHAFPGGYCGLSDIESGMQNVCMLVHQSAFEAANQGREPSIDHLVSWIGRQNDALGDWLRQARRVQDRWLAIAQIPFDAKAPLVNDVLMAGDSAGVIVPLAGDGIAMALESGALAGKMLAEVLQGDNSAHSIRKGYPAVWRRRYGGRLRFGRLLQPLLLSPAAANRMIPLIGAIPALGQFFLRSTRGKITKNRLARGRPANHVQEEQWQQHN
ncbi:MAG TPA: FAD-dependent monooxygenase, partial [Anaerolineaceae bacterium]|nr:FAD-dependent monooxygenase [Anaerolineaceae bacterium]